MDYELKSLTAQDITDASMPEFRSFVDAIRQGFHDGRPNDDTVNINLELVRNDNATLRGAYVTGGSALTDPTRPVATYASFDKSLTAPDLEQIPAHLITDVTVSPVHRRRGLLRRLITADLHEAHAAGVPVAALTASEATIYGRFGFGPATFAESVEIDTSLRFSLRHPVAGSVELVEPSRLGPAADAIFDRFHTRTPGSISRPSHYGRMTTGAWDYDKQSADDTLRAAVHLDADGNPDGYVTYRFKGWDSRPYTIKVVHLIGADASAELGLWQYLGTIDLVEKLTFGAARPGGPLPWAMSDRRGYKVTDVEDAVWLRLLDPLTCLRHNAWTGSGTVTLGVDDPLGFAAGTFRLEGSASGSNAACTVSEAGDPDVRLDVDALGSLLFGAVDVRTLAAAGRLQGDPDAIAVLAQLTVGTPPAFSATFF